MRRGTAVAPRNRPTRRILRARRRLKRLHRTVLLLHRVLPRAPTRQASAERRMRRCTLSQSSLIRRRCLASTGRTRGGHRSPPSALARHLRKSEGKPRNLRSQSRRRCRPTSGQGLRSHSRSRPSMSAQRMRHRTPLLRKQGKPRSKRHGRLPKGREQRQKQSRSLKGQEQRQEQNRSERRQAPALHSQSKARPPARSGHLPRKRSQRRISQRHLRRLLPQSSPFGLGVARRQSPLRRRKQKRLLNAVSRLRIWDSSSKRVLHGLEAQARRQSRKRPRRRPIAYRVI